jgi:hypothetical protein
MTTAIYSIANVQHALQALKEQIPPEKWSETPLPVIVAPSWWMEDLRKEMNVEEGFEPGEIHGCHVTRNENLTEPMLLDHDGRMYAILPKWLRANNSAKKEVEDGSQKTE